MRIQLSSWLKPRSKKKFILEIISICMILLIVGGILFQVNPLFRQHVLCPFCAATNSTADPDIYVISHTGKPYQFASETFLYALDGQTGKVKQADNLNTVGGVYYQKVMNGISYEVVSNGIGVPSGTQDILLATRLSDGATLWSDILDPGLLETYSNSAIVSGTVLYFKSNCQWNYRRVNGYKSYQRTSHLAI